MDKVKKCKKILKNDKIKKWIMTFKKRHDIINASLTACVTRIAEQFLVKLFIILQD